MKAHILTASSLLLALLLFVAVACTGRHEQMQQQLEMLSLHNQQDSVLTDDSLAQALADWFDDHGTPNEQLLAHYLLGRTHADRGEAPAAIASYHDAIDRAAEDCDNAQLSKVYGQMGELFYWQNMLQNALWAYDMGYQSALASGDTLLALVYYSQKGKCYYEMGMPDSLKSVTLDVQRLYLQHGDTLSASTVIEPLVYLSVEEKDFNKAAEYINQYRYHSFVAADTLSYPELWGLFRIHEGCYHLGLHHLDSAAFFFRKGLALTKNPYNRHFAYEGLYETFKATGITDSIVKYAEKTVQVNDSTVTTHIADQMQRVQALYNYDRFRHEADRMTIEAGRAEQKVTVLSLVLIVIVSTIVVVSAIAVIRRHRKHAKRLKLKVRYTADTLLFKAFNDELRRSARQPEQEKAIEEKVKFLKENLSTQPVGLETEAFADSFQECDIVVLIRKYGDEGKRLPEACWVRLRQAVNVYAPSFMYSVAAMNPGLDLTDTLLCQLALIRDMPQKAKAAALGMEYHATAMRRKRLFKDLFGKDGSARDFEKSLQRMAFGSH